MDTPLSKLVRKAVGSRFHGLVLMVLYACLIVLTCALYVPQQLDIPYVNQADVTEWRTR